jgi:hypothetical protein
LADRLGEHETEAVTAQDLIARYWQLIAFAHAKGIPVYGTKLRPFEGTVFPNYYTPGKETVRQGMNNSIRGSNEFDGVIDFERAVGDPDHTLRIPQVDDSGDHLHPNDLGGQAMANAIPLDLFRATSAALMAKKRAVANKESAAGRLPRLNPERSGRPAVCPAGHFISTSTPWSDIPRSA